MKIQKLKKELDQKADLKRSARAKCFLGIKEGGYGEGDILLGVTLPEQRKIAKSYFNLSLTEIEKLLESKIHEYRSLALIILIEQFRKAKTDYREEIIGFYLNNTKNINNWDLVDISASQILGEYLFDKKRTALYTLAKSNNLWERRIAIVASHYFIKKDDFKTTLEISKILLNDKHHLIQKAVGWMLREIGKRAMEIEKRFLDEYYKKMPRVMLRYAIEKFDENIRQDYLKGNI